MSETLDWNEVRELAQRVIERGETLVLTPAVCTLLRRTARQVAVSPEEAEQALHSVSAATELLRELARRIREGSHRLSRVLTRMHQLQEAGDIDGARQQLRDVLAIEVVPHYRDIVETALDALEED